MFHLPDNPLEEYCTTMLLNQLPDGTPSKDEKYYLLSDIVAKDAQIRIKLHTKRLEAVLAQYQFEKSDTNFNRGCLYCRDELEPTRYGYLDHLFNKHFLHLGKPENLVFIDELVDVIEHKLENLICIFCEKIFRDRATLKEHMRKKGHKRINPNNTAYDKFYLVNYEMKESTPKKQGKLQSNQRKKTQQKNQQECINEASGSTVFQVDNESDGWSEWEEEQLAITCLYCQDTHSEFSGIITHMKVAHNFDFDIFVMPYNFYQKVKIVNYIRRKIHLLHCPSCQFQFKTLEELSSHLKNENHYGTLDKSDWDQPEYFFSTFEDDPFLCSLEDCTGEQTDDSGIVVVSEESKATINKDAEALSLERLIL